MQNVSLAGVLDQRTIRTHLNANNKDDVIKSIAQMFLDAGYITNTRDFVKAVYERESEGVTGIGNHVAIPHGKSATVKQNGVAIVTLDHEIEWESLDNTGAKVVVLFAVGDNSEGAQEHLKMLAMFAKKLAKPDVIKQLLKANDIEDVMNIFEE